MLSSVKIMITVLVFVFTFQFIVYFLVLDYTCC